MTDDSIIHTSRRPALVMFAAALLAPGAASAASFMVTGARANVNILNPPGTGRCAPLNTVNISPTSLSSTGFMTVLGAFASTQSHCIPGAPSAMSPSQPITLGEFTYDFGAGDTLAGIYSGTATFANGISTSVENLIVQSGTGRFVGASGFINTMGTLGFIPNPTGAGVVGVFNGTLTGTLDIPGVPEPATWLTMIVGFGVTGTAMRRRTRVAFA